MAEGDVYRKTLKKFRELNQIPCITVAEPASYHFQLNPKPPKTVCYADYIVSFMPPEFRKASGVTLSEDEPDNIYLREGSIRIA